MTERISKLYQDLYDGNPWLEVTLVGKLEGITAEKASRKLFPNWNSIWEIVNHLISWRLEVLKRLHGEITTSPEHNYFIPITDSSEAAWQETIARLHDSQSAWLDFLKNFSEADFDKIYPGNQLSYYEHVEGILQHDAYHLGQISLLAKN